MHLSVCKDCCDVNNHSAGVNLVNVTKNRKRRPGKAARLRRAWARREQHLTKRLLHDMALTPAPLSLGSRSMMRSFGSKQKNRMLHKMNQRHSNETSTMMPKRSVAYEAKEPTLLEMKSIKKRFPIIRKKGTAAPEHNVLKKKKKNIKPMLVLQDKRILRWASLISMCNHGLCSDVDNGGQEPNKWSKSWHKDDVVPSLVIMILAMCVLSLFLSVLKLGTPKVATSSKTSRTSILKKLVQAGPACWLALRKCIWYGIDNF